MSLVWLMVHLPHHHSLLFYSFTLCLYLFKTCMASSHAAAGRVVVCRCYSLNKTASLCYSLDSCIETDVYGNWFTTTRLPCCALEEIVNWDRVDAIKNKITITFDKKCTLYRLDHLFSFFLFFYRCIKNIFFSPRPYPCLSFLYIVS